jgi:hypothetical protein
MIFSLLVRSGSKSQGRMLSSALALVMREPSLVAGTSVRLLLPA